jgi:D-Tyr-tRNA(Tyr) deacylase
MRCAASSIALRCTDGAAYRSPSRRPTSLTLMYPSIATMPPSGYGCRRMLRRHGERQWPNFTNTAPPERAEPLYEAFCAPLRELDVEVATGFFGGEDGRRAGQRRPGHDPV